MRWPYRTSVTAMFVWPMNVWIGFALTPADSARLVAVKLVNAPEFPVEG